MYYYELELIKSTFIEKANDFVIDNYKILRFELVLSFFNQYLV